MNVFGNVFDKYFRTGDLLSKDSSGLYHYQGRSDRQVKIKGHRIELYEVEFAIMTIEGVEDVAIVCYKNDSRFNEPYLVAFIYSSTLDQSDISKRITSILPRPMQPLYVHIHKQLLPRTKHNKIDYPFLENLHSQHITHS